MKILAFITLFILSSCNVYELAGQETSVSDEFEALLPHITIDEKSIKVNSGPNDYSHNSTIIRINGGENFTGVSGENFLMSGKVQLISSNTSGEFNDLVIDTTVVREPNSNELLITFGKPSAGIEPTDVNPQETLTIKINSSAYTNNLGTNVKGTTQSIRFNP